jgi:hypothetical protein
VPFPVLLTLIRSRFQAKPATLFIPIDFSFPSRGGGALRYFSLIDVGSDFHCLRSVIFFLFIELMHILDWGLV